MTQETLASSSPNSAPTGMRAFTIIWLGQIISMLGSGLTRFALGVWVFNKTREATPFAITILFATLPGLLLTPVAGALADRWNRKRIMILADSGNALLTLALAIVLFQGELQLWHIYLIALLGSVFAAFQEPAYSASIVMLAPKEKLGNANGMIQTGSALTSIFTPLLAGALFVSIGLKGIVWIDFITFFFAIGALIVVHVPQPERQPSADHKPSTLWSDILFGWTYLRQRPGLFGLLMYYAMVNFLLSWTGVLITPMTLARFSPNVLGVIETITGVGALAGSLVMSSWGGPKRRIPAVIGFIMLAWTGFLVAGLRPSPIFIGAGLFILMFFIPIAAGNSQVVFQSKVPANAQGRVFSIRILLAQSMAPLAYLTAGPLADRVFNPLMENGGALAQTFVGRLLDVGTGRGIGLMFVLAGIAALIVSALVYANPRIRNVEDELPDAL